jgi:hypothetical protein
MNAFFSTALSLTVIGFVSCSPITELKDLKDLDLSPPVLMGVRTLDSQSLELCFNEPATIDRETLSIEPNLQTTFLQGDEKVILIGVENQLPGQKYSLKATLEDQHHNSVSILTCFYGFNPQAPVVKINEFTTRGSGNHPDVAELKVLKEGNMGGLVLYQGTPENWKDRLVFPAFSVSSGDFILVHYKPQGTSDEIDETQQKDVSGGYDASDTAFDFWIQDGGGISGNNGVLSLYERPGGPIIDGILYSNRTSDSDERYLGFGTKDTMERALELHESGGWIAEQERIRPEDGINPEGSTGTRSICRRKGDDTDTRLDWYIVPTRHASFGEDNSEEVYTP